MIIVEAFMPGAGCTVVLARKRCGGGPRERRRLAARMLRDFPGAWARAFDGGPRGYRIPFGGIGGRDGAHVKREDVP